MAGKNQAVGGAVYRLGLLGVLLGFAIAFKMFESDAAAMALTVGLFLGAVGALWSGVDEASAPRRR